MPWHVTTELATLLPPLLSPKRLKAASILWHEC